MTKKRCLRKKGKDQEMPASVSSIAYARRGTTVRGKKGDAAAADRERAELDAAPVRALLGLCQKQNIHDTFNMVDGERI